MCSAYESGTIEFHLLITIQADNNQGTKNRVFICECTKVRFYSRLKYLQRKNVSKKYRRKKKLPKSNVKELSFPFFLLHVLRNIWKIRSLH